MINTIGYEITKDGRVFNCKGDIKKELKQSTINAGYKIVGINGTVYTVHRLMAQTYLGYTPINGMHIDHKDKNPFNNHIDNLQIITHRENNTKDRTNITGYTGVYVSSVNTFRSMISFKSVRVKLGNADTALKSYLDYLGALETINEIK